MDTKLAATNAVRRERLIELRKRKEAHDKGETGCVYGRQGDADPAGRRTSPSSSATTIPTHGHSGFMWLESMERTL